ncbi:MAG: hypothetical protein EXR84_05900 [Gammaproteobacteria bacterium]|nr:hypothetical protein [Gammaproteobacteria bacterium]
MKSPAQALLWRSWRLICRQLLLHQIVIIGFCATLLGLAIPATPFLEFSGSAKYPVLVSLLILYFTIHQQGFKSSSLRDSAGFPYHLDFKLPVSTALIVFLPLAYLCLLMVAAYFIPMLILSLWFDVIGPQFAVAFMILQVTLLVSALSWWSSSAYLNMLGWGVVLFLEWYQWLFPGLTVSDQTGAIVVLSPTEYGLPVALTAALLWVMWIGIKKQRCGDTLFGIRQDPPRVKTTFTLRNLFPRLRSNCPTSSTLAAELRKFRQLRGFSYALSVGVAAGVLVLTGLRLISLKAPAQSPIEFELVILIPACLLFLICMFSVSNIFNIRIYQGTAFFSVFEKTLPMSTARMVSINAAGVVLGLILICLAMNAIVWIAGPLFLEGFAQIQATALETLVAFGSQSFFSMARAVLLLLAQFASACLILPVIVVWSMLKPALFTRAVIAIPAYWFLISIVFVLLEEAAWGESMRAFALQHLWLVVIAIPATVFVSFRSIMRDRILSTNHLYLLGAVCFALAWLHIDYIMRLDMNLDALPIVLVATLLMWGLMPLLAVGTSLRAMSKIRHG